MTIHVALIDDEPLIVNALQSQLTTTVLPPPRVTVYDRPRRLLEDPEVSTVTHAIVDLSFGRQNYDLDHFARETETGLDAIVHLRKVAPGAVPVVVSSVETPFNLEVGIAIRQWWPTIRFISKADSRVPQLVQDFVQGQPPRDNAEIALLLRHVSEIGDQRLRQVIATGSNQSATMVLLRLLARTTDKPSSKSLALEMGNSENFVRRLINDVSGQFKSESIFAQREVGGLERLWEWSRARRAILDVL